MNNKKTFIIQGSILVLSVLSILGFILLILSLDKKMVVFLDKILIPNPNELVFSKGMILYAVGMSIIVLAFLISAILILVQNKANSWTVKEKTELTKMFRDKIAIFMLLGILLVFSYGIANSGAPKWRASLAQAGLYIGIIFQLVILGHITKNMIFVYKEGL